MKLSSLFPQNKSSFMVEINGRKFKMHLRSFTLADEAWLEENFTAEQLKEKIEKVKVIEICKIAAHQLDIKSKRILSRVKVMDVDPETGEDVEIKTTMADRLLHAMVGNDNWLNMYKAVIHERLKAFPQIEKFIKENFAEDKKKVIATT